MTKFDSNNTSRLQFLLETTQLPFEIVDLATNPKAKELWYRCSQGKSLPAVVKQGKIIGNIDDIENANELGQLKEIDTQVVVELKNDLSIKGILKSCDQFLNLRIDDCQSPVKNMFIRGSVVRYVHLPSENVDTSLLEDATRREAQIQSQKNER
ncbi:hypothetical protein PMAC_000245 [Pneumocystis sp. 'macacae']|nr:hypothetical protein PMAC_000245 [Pneumocystis sp. 'macacae']